MAVALSSITFLECVVSYFRVPAEKWEFVSVAVAPSSITISEHGVSYLRVPAEKWEFVSVAVAPVYHHYLRTWGQIFLGYQQRNESL